MEKGVNVATKKLFVTIAAKLFGESARFRTKGMLQWLQTETPILSGGPVNKYQYIF
jgi:hypothetical protein